MVTAPPPAPPAAEPTLGEIARVFLKLGATAFGGPAAHIALMRDELVRRRGWISDRDYLDLIGVSGMIPGPTSTEVAIHVGAAKAGGRGLVVAGACFILPAFAIVLAIAWAYVRFGSLPEVAWLLYGITPVMVAVVAVALWALAKTAVKGPATAAAGAVVFLLALAGLNELLLLAAGALAVFGWELLRRRTAVATVTAWPLVLAGLAPLTAQAAGGATVGLLPLFWFFLKTGSVLFGSGYVLLAFLHADLVERWGWLTNQQLLDAVAVGQFTPGPVFTTATFIGYVLAGWGGAVVATVGIFLPAFVFVWLTRPLIRRMRASARLSALLDGLNVASLGLMAAVTVQLARAALIDPFTWALGAVALLVLLRFNPNSAWIVLTGAAAGFAWKLAGL
jgi:chromate transporter